MTQPAVRIPGLVAGTWAVDPVHSEVSFTVRHMMVSKVRGSFTEFEIELRVAENALDSSVTATIALNSVDTRNEQRDNHIRSADFFEVEKYPTMTYRSTGIRPDGDDFVIEGELSLHGVTRPVELATELTGVSKDPFGGTRAGFSATTEISRSDFGVDISLPMDGGGVVVSDRVRIELEIEAVLSKEA
ncbi:MAG TPA: YceI family protein [Mycobacteriales bacterium]|nr:YceI family protein [Mycobacteriales bacterium]